MKNKMPKNTSLDRWFCLEYDAFLLLGVSKTILETLSKDHPQYDMFSKRIEELEIHYLNRNAFPRAKCKPFSAEERIEKIDIKIK
jgi:hypothetical protein